MLSTENKDRWRDSVRSWTSVDDFRHRSSSLGDDDDDDNNEIQLPIPSQMNICIMIVGTHGDVAPFLKLADLLVDAGHRVRMATHTQHRKLVETVSGHEFFPLAGDAKQLSAWMVETGGTIVGEARSPRIIPQKMVMTKNIIRSTWPAVTEPNPFDVEGRPFEADAVIANPPCFGHIHVCEALGIPLHIMFPQPWYYGTKEFPHPMSGLPYGPKRRELNFRSYAAFEAIVEAGLQGFINRWRSLTLRLPTFSADVLSRSTTFSGASTAIPDCRIPFSAMWSPSFVPKPKDWPVQCRVVGTFHEGRGHSKPPEVDTTKFAALIEWIQAGPKPIFVGFGSMVIEHPAKLAAIIVEAAELVNCRVVVQSSWSKMDVGTGLKNRCHNVGPVSHDWLLPQCAAVVHHGGAGTTAAGLRFGLPTFICPFFGDQHMWGEMVRRAGVGPAPCSVWDLTAELMAEKFSMLRDAQVEEKAAVLAEQMSQENGILAGLEHFFEDLPRDDMLCDASILLGEAQIAKYKIWGRLIPGMRVSVNQQHGLKVGVDAGAVILKEFAVRRPMLQDTVSYMKSWFTQFKNIVCLYFPKYRRHQATNYRLGLLFGFAQGFQVAFLGCFRHFLLMLFQPCCLPDRWARGYGMLGCASGCIMSPFYMVYQLLLALLVLVDRLATSFSNSCCGTQYEYICDRRGASGKVRELGTVAMAIEKKVDEGISECREKEVLVALSLAAEMKFIFVCARPYYPADKHWNYKVVLGSKMISQLKKARASRGCKALKLSEMELETFLEVLEKHQDEELSFSKVLFLLRRVIVDRPPVCEAVSLDGIWTEGTYIRRSVWAMENDNVGKNRRAEYDRKIYADKFASYARK